MNNFIAIDFETASEQRTTPISVGIVKIENNELNFDQTFFSLINPRTTIFNQISIGKHGLTYEKVKHAPDFIELWNKVLKSLVRENIVIVHQTATDISVIRKCIELYELDQVDFKYISTLEIAKNLKVDVNKFGMKELCNLYNIPYSDNHKSDEDAVALGKLFLELSKSPKFKINKYLKDAFPISFIKSDVYNNSIEDAEEKYQITYAELKTIDFKDKSFIISGDSIESFSRDKIKKAIIAKGGIIKEDISSNLDFLIAGIGVGPAKLTKIDALNSSGKASIKIIPLLYFIDLL
ncbi:MAG TPA: hypothetical protein DCR40_10290 [Prolixibacteraceae bacterium]|nr:hypothetical protein [Prolixibacteraceae bacterium]